MFGINILVQKLADVTENVNTLYTCNTLLKHVILEFHHCGTTLIELHKLADYFLLDNTMLFVPSEMWY